jgi:aminotransferase
MIPVLAARRTSTFGESMIREMTRLADLHGAVNLAQGFPDFPMPDAMKEAACAAIKGDINQYAVTYGAPVLRQGIAEKYRRWYQMEVDPDENVTVTCGATEAMATAFMALLNPGDEVIILEPFYENYGPDAILAGATPVIVPLTRDTWTLDEVALRKAFTSRTKAIVVNTPHNPTGRVLTRAEIDVIAGLCVEHDVWAVSDAPYEHMVFAGHHHEIATWPGMRERTITISSLSKTYSATGWRIGWIVSPAGLTNAIRQVHDFLTVGAAAPLQAAAAVGFAFDADYYNHFTILYKQKRDFMCAALREAGFKFAVPEGAYYIFADFSDISDLDDVTFAKWMTQEIGIATVPGSGFFANPEHGRIYTRFAFCKKQETLDDAAARVAELKAALAG